MADDFDFQYEDELDALNDIEDDFDPWPRKGKKSLDFSTPRTKQPKAKTRPGTNLNESLMMTPLDSPTEAVNGIHDGSFIEAQSQTQSSQRSIKRNSDDMYKSLQVEEQEENVDNNFSYKPRAEDELPDMAPRTKKPRLKGPSQLPDDPMDDFEITPPPSPSEMDEIDRIKLQRTQNRVGKTAMPAQNDEDRISANYDFERKRVHSKIPPGAFFHATSEEGKRMYMGLKTKDSLTREIDRVFSGQKSLQLLGTPLEVLKIQVAEERTRRLVQESERLSQMLEKDDEDSIENVQGKEPAASEEKTEELWVERYAPKRYTQLLSDESTNRTLLKWLKLWDHVVFGKEKKAKHPKEKDQKKVDPKKKFFNKNLPDVPDELDPHNRPMHKVSLLSGPPGLGKTTLAHVIAKHAGYNVVEMNASDDRSVDVFKQKIEAATQMKAVMGADPRPNCLIIDEIDGSPVATINVLLDMVRWADDKTSKKKKKGNLLLRPIICICNDLYVPALRQLRQCALVVNFPQTVSGKLASRLLEVSRNESLKTDMTTLLALCEKSDNDIRSCLNTLQFVRSRCKELSLYSIHSMSLGQKDAHKTLFFVWHQIFTMPKPKRKRYVNPYDRTTNIDAAEELALSLAHNNTSLPARFHNTLQLAQATGEYEKVMQGLYENYLESRVKDPHMENVLLANEWMIFTDCLNQQIAHSQNYSIGRYLPYLPVTFHLLFASNHPQKVQYPHTNFENIVKLQKSENLIQSMLNDVAPSVRKNVNLSITVMDILPPLMCIIQPNLRPINTQLYSSKEKEDLAQLIRIMIAYNMTYHQERTPEGQYTYSLDPNMDEVIRFPGLKPSRQLTYAAKQLIAREIELERMRRSEAAIGTKQRNQAAQAAVKSAAKPTAPKTGDRAGPSSAGEKGAELPNYMRQKLEPKVLGVVEQQAALDFFGRKIMKTAPDMQQKKEKKKQEIIGGDIWFRFKQGFTNAVRRNVKVQDLI